MKGSDVAAGLIVKEVGRKGEFLGAESDNRFSSTQTLVVWNKDILVLMSEGELVVQMHAGS